MTRRASVLLVSGVLSLVLAVALMLLPVPYASIAPGPTYNALGSTKGPTKGSTTPVIDVKGREVFPTEGQLRVVTIEAYGKPIRLTLGRAIKDWIDPHVAVVPLENVFPENKSTKDMEAENNRAMQESQLEAKVAALDALDIPMTVLVAATNEGFPADGVLEAGDEVVSIDGRRVGSMTELTELIGRHAVGEKVDVTYKRDGVEKTVTLPTAPAPDDPERPLLGVSPDFRLPFTVDVSLGNVGGPSAGLMFALAIYDKLSEGPLAGSAVIAGTGTIDASGVVGPIGGVQQKIFGAARDGAKVFLVPHANCKSIETVPDGMRLVDVTSMEDALADLELLRSGGTPAGCS